MVRAGASSRTCAMVTARYQRSSSSGVASIMVASVNSDPQPPDLVSPCQGFDSEILKPQIHHSTNPCGVFGGGTLEKAGQRLNVLAQHEVERAAGIEQRVHAEPLAVAVRHVAQILAHVLLGQAHHAEAQHI